MHYRIDNNIDEITYDNYKKSLSKQYLASLKHDYKKNIIYTYGDQIIHTGNVSKNVMNQYNSEAKNAHGKYSADKYREKLKQKYFKNNK